MNHLLLIHDLSMQFLNSGSLIKALHGFIDKLRVGCMTSV